MTTKMYTYKRERAKRLYPDPAIFNKNHYGSVGTTESWPSWYVRGGGMHEDNVYR